MSNAAKKIYTAFRELQELYEATAAEYIKLCKKKKVRITKRLSDSKAEKLGYNWEDEVNPIYIYRFDDYAYQTAVLLATEIEFIDKNNPSYIQITERWDEENDEIAEGPDVGLFAIENINAIDSLIDIMQCAIDDKKSKA